MAYLTAIREVFPIEAENPKHGRDRTADTGEAVPRFEGVHAFLDDFARGRPPGAAWAAFAGLGLVRVSVGMVSGDREVRLLYDQRWSDEDLVATFADLKSAGIGASVLTLVGAGGIEDAESHVARRAAVIRSLNLRAGDFVFLFNENEVRDPINARLVMPILSGSAWQQEQAKLKEALAGLKDRKVKVLPYTMEKQGI